MDYLEALNLFENGKIDECIDYFNENDYQLEYAYSLILSGI